MALMLWNSRFETGIGIIDTQHKALFKAVNDLADSFKAGTSKTQVKECLDFLVKYTVDHFSTRRKVMKEDGLSQAHLPHRGAHPAGRDGQGPAGQARRGAAEEAR